MNSKNFLVGTVAGAILFGSLAGGAFAVGPTCNVPSVTYPTIQSAASDPTCTTVNVAAGTYNENVVIGHTLTLSGAQDGVDARTRSGSESVINGGTLATITITANDVIVDGFTLNGPPSSGTAAIVMQTGNTGEKIQNNIINNPGRAASFTTSNTVFRKNVVNNTTTSSDGFQANTVPVQNVTLADNNFSGADPTIYNADITIIEGNSNIIVSDNKSIGDGTLIALFKTNGAKITDNDITGGGGSSAIYIGGSDSNVSVRGNRVSSAGSAVKVTVFPGAGLGPNSSVKITKNKLQTNIYGVNVVANSVTNTVVAHRNLISGNTTFGVFNDPSSGGLVNGTCNFWGASNGPGPVGPGSGDKVSTGVVYSPWLTSANLSGQCGDSDQQEDNN